MGATKFCSGCRAIKGVNEFNRNRAQRDGLSNWCRACKRAHRVSESGKAAMARANRKRKYGITGAMFESMLRAQGYRCALCTGPFGAGRKDGPEVDHLHGHCSDDPRYGCPTCVRGLLHNGCNNLVALFERQGYTNSGLDEFIREYLTFNDERICSTEGLAA